MTVDFCNSVYVCGKNITRIFDVSLLACIIHVDEMLHLWPLPKI